MELRRGGTIIQRMRVPLGFLCGILFLVFAKPEPITLIIGGIIAVLGIALRAWAAGHIRKNAELAISGPYAFTRNPLYLGSLVLCFGFALCSGRWWLSLIFGAIFLLIYLPVMQAEVKELVAIFGEKYENYAHNVPLLFPRLTPFRNGDVLPKFDVSLYLRYREYRAALGLFLAWSILAVKVYFQL